MFFEPSDLPPPSDSTPTVTEPEETPVAPVRNSIARVSFREPISCSYSVEEDDWEEEETVEVNRNEEEEEQEDDGEEAVGSLGHRLRFCTGVPSKIDLLGKIALLSKAMMYLIAFSKIEKYHYHSLTGVVMDLIRWEIFHYSRKEKDWCC